MLKTFAHVSTERQTNIHTYIHTHTFHKNNFRKPRHASCFEMVREMKTSFARAGIFQLFMQVVLTGM